jgi:hypothetical protein
MKLLFLIFILNSIIFQVHSSSSDEKNKFGRLWQRIEIPGAKCGNGKPYSVWFDKGINNKKLTVELMGGGACWSKETCYGPNFKSWLFPIPRVPVMSLLTVNNRRFSPAAEGNYLYFPYCTADVWAGNHKVNYLVDKSTFHYGHSNLRKSFDYLFKNNFLQIDYLDDLIIYGASAGAIGGFLHSEFIASQFINIKNKSLIADAPGLHFGDSFWEKFPEKFINDINRSLEEIGLGVDLRTGNLSLQINLLCERMNDWNIGILQGSRDYFMSEFFGEISQDDHHDLIFSDRGIWELSKPYAHCSSWIKKTGHHTFLVFPHSWFLKVGKISAHQFTFDITNQKQNISVRD